MAETASQNPPPESGGAVESAVGMRRTVLDSPGRVRAVLGAHSGAERVALAVATDRSGRGGPVGDGLGAVGFCFRPGVAYCVPFEQDRGAQDGAGLLDALRPLLGVDGPPKVVHDAKPWSRLGDTALGRHGARCGDLAAAWLRWRIRRRRGDDLRSRRLRLLNWPRRRVELPASMTWRAAPLAWRGGWRMGADLAGYPPGRSDCCTNADAATICARDADATFVAAGRPVGAGTAPARARAGPLDYLRQATSCRSLDPGAGGDGSAPGIAVDAGADGARRRAVGASWPSGWRRSRATKTSTRSPRRLPCSTRARRSNGMSEPAGTNGSNGGSARARRRHPGPLRATDAASARSPGRRAPDRRTGSREAARIAAEPARLTSSRGATIAARARWTRCCCRSTTSAGRRARAGTSAYGSGLQARPRRAAMPGSPSGSAPLRPSALSSGVEVWGRGPCRSQGGSEQSQNIPVRTPEGKCAPPSSPRHF